MIEARILERFYEEVLDLRPEWKAVRVWKDPDTKAVYIDVEYAGNEYKCPICGKVAKRHDWRTRQLRHLDTCDYETILNMKVPRVRCEEHKVQQIPVSFADKSSQYTEMFEMRVLKRLEGCTVKEVCDQMNLSWSAIQYIKMRAVQRGLDRREIVKVEHIGIDETSFQKGHNYITTIVNKDNNTVLAVLEGRDSETVKNWFKTQKVADFSELKSVSMDLGKPFIKAIKETFDNWAELICFDRFHISQLLNRALNDVRKTEHAILAAIDKDNNPLAKMRFAFLHNSNRMDNRTAKRKNFLSITRMNLKSSRAWRIKETASQLWDYLYVGAAEKNWKALLFWMSHCRIPQMVKAGKTIKEHMWGILNAIRMKATNAVLESMNNCIQRFKRMAFGYRNIHNFITDVFFHFGGLDMVIAVHQKPDAYKNKPCKPPH